MSLAFVNFRRGCIIHMRECLTFLLYWYEEQPANAQRVASLLRPIRGGYLLAINPHADACPRGFNTDVTY